ncbi:MAG TPA: hypothetical protein VLX92_21540 [Kofleriaceae bacterium]|nr:hypothetical protein [Kofleriaceae bacterium]
MSHRAGVLALLASARALAAPSPDPLRPPHSHLRRGVARKVRAEARSHYLRAVTLYERRKYIEALAELAAADAKDPEPDWQWAIAKVRAAADECGGAIVGYQQYLENKLDKGSIAAANAAIAECTARLPPPRAREPEPTPAVRPTTPPAHEPEPAPVLAVHATAPHHWYGDTLGDGLVASGLVSGITGIVLYRAALSDRDAADHATAIASYARDLDDARRDRTYALVAGGVGIALVTAGVVRFVLHDRERLSIAPAPGGATLSLAGSWP